MQQTFALSVYSLGALMLLLFTAELKADVELEEDYRRQYYNKSQWFPAPRLRVGLREDDTIPGQFIIGLRRRHFSSDQLTRLRERLREEFEVRSNFTIDFGTFKAFFAHAINESVAKRVLSNPDVEFLEPNRVVKSLGDQCRDSKTGRTLWGLTRTGRREAIPDKWRSDRLTYSSSSHNDGSGVDAYVLDTGILTTHVEFGGRASWGMVASDINEPTEDLGGHGTHVSGTIGGDTVGAATAVNLIAVKVLNGQGSGSTAGMLEGIQWVIKDFQNKEKLQGKRPKAVCNLSLGFNGRSPATDYAVAHAVEAGLNMVVAAGNSYQDACLSSPRAGSAITVAASDIADDLAKFSNWGTCVDIVAPGVDILSSYCTNSIAYAVMSGTSMAAPLVSGTVARYLSSLEETPTPAEVKSWLLNTSTKDALTYVDSVHDKSPISESLTPNKLLYMDCKSVSEASSAATKIRYSSVLMALGLGGVTFALNM